MAFRRRHLVPCQPNSADEQFISSIVDIVATKFATAYWNGEYDVPLHADYKGMPSFTRMASRFQAASALQAVKSELEVSMHQ